MEIWAEGNAAAVETDLLTGWSCGRHSDIASTISVMQSAHCDWQLGCSVGSCMHVPTVIKPR